MTVLKYKVIESRAQYTEYADILEGLMSLDLKTKDVEDEIALLTVLIEKWDGDHSSFDDPIALLRSLMEERELKPKDLVDILGVSKGLVSDILNYKKGLSKESIRILAEYFRVDQEAFNRRYKLIV